MSHERFSLLGVVFLFALLLAACGRAATPAPTQAQAAPAAAASATPADRSPTPGSRAAETETLPDYEIITLLPRDAIPAIFEPEFLSAAEGDAEYGDHEQVLGIEIDGDTRAYSIPFLSSHEIVNDVVGGTPVAVTW
ncbi:MAG: DUF3179 domain-containing protein [Caldilineae bacterium]|nr:MAG: DUF3179 domain-containing protein [Caldilineae bacterium]